MWVFYPSFHLLFPVSFESFMKKVPKHLRPKSDFRINCLQQSLDIEKAHQKAGFEAIPYEIVARRYFQFISFLQSKNLTSRVLLENIASVSGSSELRNHDLTEEGFYFIQQYHDRWAGRLYKDKGHAKESEFLEKWYLKFKSEFSIQNS